MTVERDVTENLIARLNLCPPPRVVIKHNDRSTSGIPDLTFTWRGHTHWIEDKYRRGRERVRSLVDMVQVVTAIDLNHAAPGRAFFVVYEARPRAIVLWTPRRMLDEMRSNVGIEPFTYPGPMVMDVAKLLDSVGAFRFPGHDHDVVVRLIKDLDRPGASLYHSRYTFHE